MAKSKYEAKTKETVNSVTTFLDTVEEDQKRDDAKKLIKIFTDAAGFEAKMWGPSIVGFGSYHYVYESGHEGDAPLAGFSPRKNALVLYLASSPEDRESYLAKLGKHKPGKGCIYIKELEDIDPKVLKEMIKTSVKFLKQTYPSK